ncbi:chaplin family protein [Streptomyces spirodelae]|uniref:DUF320 domain-containing protein n=1 Tax=Streptomyces spirodelae TaxID=2812904 RepID=A0ABS3WRL7_9ACTN|nr:chaplin family protein [Streptomyces spirodelae]MBO8185664.1 DUF320 domain-containing protein [Streptomyces spirodelae]
MRQGTRKGLMTMAAAGGLLAMSGGTAFADSGAHGGSANSPGVLSGNTVQAPVNVTVNVCGNTVNVVGVLNPASGNGCGNGSRGGDGPSPQGGHGAHAGGSAHGSPGVGSGNTAQVPVDVPVNACGNTVDVVGALNPAHGNGCANESKPSNPGPVDPGYPEEPGNPGEPGEPGEPGNPEEPGEPGQPEQPGEPGEPEQPGEPGEPGNPGEPGKPGQPGEPGQPSEPSAPNEPGSTGEVHAPSEPEAVAASDKSGATEPDSGGSLAHTGAGSQLGLAAPLSVGMLAGGYVLYRRSRAATRR